MTASVPPWLDAPPDESLVAPPVDTRAQDLPFGDLTWENFERLLVRIVRRQETIDDCVLYGTKGQAQEGLDILAVTTDAAATYACYQCKRVKEFGAGDIRKAVTKFLGGKWANRASEFVLCVAIPLNNAQQLDEIANQRERLKNRGITFYVWDGSSAGALSDHLKQLPEVVDDFFGRPWVKRFNGEEVAASLTERLDAIELGKLRKRLLGLYATVFNQHDPGLRTLGLETLSYVDRYVPIDVIEQTTLRPTQPEKAAPSEVTAEGLPASTPDKQQPEVARATSNLNIHEARKPAFEWLFSKQHCVVLGEPGYGKSALLRYIALSLLDPVSANIPLLDHNHLRRLPVWISFARYAAILKQQPDASVIDYVGAWLHQHSFDDLYPLFERALRHSDVLLLVDGLDEGTSEQHRREALDRIITFVKSSDAAVICTSRPRGFSRTGTPDSWTSATIAPMREAQVQELAARWFSVTEIDGEANGPHDVSSEQAQHRAEAFLHAVNENRRTHDLARNPLLCLVMIELFRFAHRLPEARVGAYDKIIELLLSRHPAARAHAAYGETPAKSLGLQDADLRQILIRIAADLQNNPATGVTNADNCRSICMKFLEDDTFGLGLDKTKARRLAKDVIEQLVAHYGLLVERSPGEISFVHLSIQEYLTAEFVSRDSEDKQLAWLEGAWMNPMWRECVTSWFGIQGARGNKGLTGRAAQLLSQLGEAGEWQRLQSIELRVELACADLGLPISESRKAVQQATQEVETSPFPIYRKSLGRIITLGALGSAVSDKCTESVRRWVPGRSSFARARLLRTFQSWQLADDLRETLLRALHDEELHCRRAAVDCLVALYGSCPDLPDTLRQLAVHHTRPEVRATALQGLTKCPKWEEHLATAAAANLQSSSAELLLASCGARIQLGCHDDDDLQYMWRVWSTDAGHFELRSDLSKVLCDGWPTHASIRMAFTELLQPGGPSMERQLPIEYLVRCYPNDEEVATLLADLFDRHGIHIVWDIDPIWRHLAANFRGHPKVASAVRKALDAHKKEFAAIFWGPNIVPGLIVIGDDAARDELLGAYPVEEGMNRYWIAKTLVDGWPDDATVQSSLRHWSAQDADTAAPLAQWATMLYPRKADRHKWLKRLVGDASSRIVSDAISALLDEFPDDESRRMVESRVKDGKIWYYQRIHIEGWLAREFPTRQSSLDTFDCALRDIDGPVLSDFATSYQDNLELRPKILSAAVVAPEDVRMTVAATLKDRAIDVQTIERLTPQVFAEESGPVRSTALIALARATKGNEKAVQILADTLINELLSLGPYHESRRRTALAAMIELGQAERAVLTLVERDRPSWTHCLVDPLNQDMVSIGAIVNNWHKLKPLLEASGLELELPIKGFVECGYGAVLDQAAPTREALDCYLQTASTDPFRYYFDEISRRFPRSAFLKERLLTEFDGRPYDHRPKYIAARLLVEHFRSDAEVLAELIARLEPTNGDFQVTPPGVIAILALGWPGSLFEDWLQSVDAEDRAKWSAGDRLLAAVSLRDAIAAEEAAKSLLAEPLQDWRYRREDVEALRYWSRDSISTPVLKEWVKSDNGTLSITGLSLVGHEQPNQLFSTDNLIERFNEQMTDRPSPPTDGLDAIAGGVTSLAIRASAAIFDSIQR